ncbi:HepT-like ribonuclease domain-containing protein [Aequorivita ciconiae]|uniref:HepT-like ribonuclease domain-containing protein n=1 Tax=Aequorivita ciconiae TaxID=2494375 RepID=UPI001F0BAE8A|nr:HepT-like ribonuclease domain-containing protein [Aequorivita sp. H23M31]
MGEATKRLDNNFKTKYPDVPWKKMAAFRDVLIHDYERLIPEMILKTPEEDLPNLKRQLLHILENEK